MSEQGQDLLDGGIEKEEADVYYKPLARRVAARSASNQATIRHQPRKLMRDGAGRSRHRMSKRQSTQGEPFTETGKASRTATVSIL